MISFERGVCVQWFRAGGYSMLLTVINIFCVMIVGIIVLRLKRVRALW